MKKYLSLFSVIFWFVCVAFSGVPDYLKIGIYYASSIILALYIIYIFFVKRLYQPKMQSGNFVDSEKKSEIVATSIPENK